MGLIEPQISGNVLKLFTTNRQHVETQSIPKMWNWSWHKLTHCVPLRKASVSGSNFYYCNRIGLIPHGLQLQVQVISVNLGWLYKLEECAKFCVCVCVCVDQCMSVIRKVEVPVSVSIHSSSNHVTAIRGPQGVWDSRWRLSRKMSGTLWMQSCYTYVQRKTIYFGFLFIYFISSCNNNRVKILIYQFYWVVILIIL
jgi:hypothetical protein